MSCNHRQRPVRLALLGAALGALLSGCREEPKGFERYVPAPERARAAVALAMEGWRKGLTADETVGTHPEVHVVDKQRRADRHVAAYEILGEVSAENARGFAVRVTFDDSDDPQFVRFLVVGADPMWVFRQEDYDMISHWMHPMDEPADRAGEAPKAP